MGDNQAPAKLVIGLALETPHIERLRREFPDAAFVIAASRDAVREEIGDADALIGPMEVTADLLAAAPKLRWLQAGSAGVEKFLIPELVKSDIVLTNLSGVHAPNIAEHVLALILAFARGLPQLLHMQDRHRWPDDEDEPPARFELEGQTIGIVGLGDIGEALARKAHGLGMRVLATRRHIEEPPEFIEQLIPSENLAELLAAADHVVLTLPLTEATRHTIGADELAQMKRTAYFYNIGRGGLVDQEALIAELRAGTIAGAGLDVTTPEPLPPDSPLWDLPNVLVTGHTSGNTPKYWERGIELVSENIRRFLAGESLVNEVDKAAGY